MPLFRHSLTRNSVLLGIPSYGGMSLEVLFALVSRTISRVMSRMIIYLGVSLPKPSSDLPESGPGRSLLSVWSCSGWGLHSPSRYRDGGSLLHCHSTLTGKAGGIFLLHSPWSHLRQTLSGIPPCEARTFLSHSLSVLWQRPSVLL